MTLVAILSGAGISTDSGIPDYRGPQGLWRRDPEAAKLVTYDYYMADPEIRRRSWQMRRDSTTWRAEPNAAHRAIAELDRQPGFAVRVITPRRRLRTERRPRPHLRSPGHPHRP